MLDSPFETKYFSLLLFCIRSKTGGTISSYHFLLGKTALVSSVLGPKLVLGAECPFLRKRESYGQDYKLSFKKNFIKKSRSINMVWAFIYHQLYIGIFENHNFFENQNFPSNFFLLHSSIQYAHFMSSFSSVFGPKFHTVFCLSPFW